MPFGRKSTKVKKDKGKKKKGAVERGDFMSEPTGGWLHDQQALNFGKGIFYSYPVRYVGSIQVVQSLRSLSTPEKTAICREAINRTGEAAKLIKVKRKAPPRAKEFLADTPFLKVLDLKINISAKGIVTTSIPKREILANDPIAKISFAAGGVDKSYFWFTYVAKDRRDNRYCHVFDGGALADDILATLGQVFSLLATNNLPVKSAPPLPPNHPSLLQGAAALAAAPKMPEGEGVNMVIAQEILQYGDDEENYEGIEDTGAVNPLMQQELAASGEAAPAAKPLENYEELDEDAGALSYGDMAPISQPHVVPRERTASQPAIAGKRSAPPPPTQQPMDEYTEMSDAIEETAYGGAIDLYEHLQGPATSNGESLANFLNVKAFSRNIYGDDDEDASDAIYGDGTVGWSYLDVKPEADDTYGTLADFASGL
ncbi:uncharacterized protein MONBRDRAFT_32006 [Monosiga brevicollis MX1]|uniref:PID domain-containing protein n=1 Tax=Monosiga brevicollis TaxID=81824 RepID=A9UWT7_MONBE|nr:uncharacterized protein MONBRDRAFT_32006 [Monosiga brevicollis MX1]EDQ90099.1 predicted protein [Monosiga brevicollis MX1]|eukprot:XP_001744866.1 hypothetical protein [Monosiga brevicollis MX1]